MGKDKKTTKTSYENRRTQPAWMTAGSRRAVDMAMGISERDYEGYGGQRIADLSQNEQLGMEGFAGEAGRYDADFDKARGALDSVGSFTDEGVREKYMNPYIEGVLLPGVRRRDRAYGAQSAELKRTSGMRGAFGGRQNVAEDMLNKSNQEGLDDLYASGYGRAFDTAAALHGSEQDRSIRQAGAYAMNAQTQAGVNANTYTNMMNSGLVDRTRDQADLDFQYLEHLEERDWDVTNLSTLVNTLASVPVDSTTSGESTTTETTSANPIKTIAGIAAITAGAIMTGGTSLALPMAAAGAQTAFNAPFQDNGGMSDLAMQGYMN